MFSAHLLLYLWADGSGSDVLDARSFIRSQIGPPTKSHRDALPSVLAVTQAKKLSTPPPFVDHFMCVLTFDMSGMARLAGACPLDGGVRRLVEHLLAYSSQDIHQLLTLTR